MEFTGLSGVKKDPGQDVLPETFSIITTDPNRLMQSIHTRMPVILFEVDWSRWLGPV
jgi:putative SOS response-associated peptidase YedK